MSFYEIPTQFLNKVHCCYFDQGDLNRPLESNTNKFMKTNTGEIHIGSEGEQKIG